MEQHSAYASFREAAQSLKLYRRAELLGDDGDELIESLYVDPLPNDHVLETLLLAHTTFLIGRKGTGKSTVFQRAQQELRKKSTVVSAYVDIKSVYESSRVDQDTLNSARPIKGALSADALERLWLNRDFFVEILTSIKEEVQKKLESSTLLEKIAEHFRATNSRDLFVGLDALISKAKSSHFESAIGAVDHRSSTSYLSEEIDSTDGGLNGLFGHPVGGGRAG